MAKPGCPSTYTAEVAELILELLAEGQSLKEICRENPCTPDDSTVRKWALDDVQGFAARYSRAREIGYHSMADEIFDIADDARNDWMDRHNSRTGESDRVPDNEHMNRSRLRVDTRKWFLSKVLPKIYGDKIAVTGADGGAVKTETVNRIELVGVVAVLPPPY
jgi:hypothetical protein